MGSARNGAAGPGPRGAEGGGDGAREAWLRLTMSKQNRPAQVEKVVRLVAGRRALPLRLYVAGGLAWYSHVLLATMYNHGRGIAIYWPVSRGRLSLAVPWFSTMNPRDLWSAHNLRVWAIEASVYGAIFAAACYGRHLMTRRKKNSIAL